MKEPNVQQVTCCPMCGDPRGKRRFEAADVLHGVPGRFTYVTCAGCGTTYQNPRVRDADLARCYPSAYFTHEAVPLPDARAPDTRGGQLRAAVVRRCGGLPADACAPLALRVAGRLASAVPPLRRRALYGLPDAVALRSPGARCLELGPGLGHDLLQLSRLGWDASGLEVDPAAAQSAAAASHRPVAVGSLADAPWPDATFALIYSSHVFEHLAEPRDACGRMLRLLRPGGRTVMVYPNPRSLTARAWGRHAVVWDPPRHLVLAPARATAALLEEVGFSNIRVRTLARRASNYSAIARSYRSGQRGPSAWDARIDLLDRLTQAVEVAGNAVGCRVGEELLVTAERPR